MNLNISDPYTLFKDIESVKTFYSNNKNLLDDINFSLINKGLDYNYLLPSYDPDHLSLEYYFDELLKELIFQVSNLYNIDFFEHSTNFYNNILSDVVYTIHWLNTNQDWITYQSLNPTNSNSLERNNWGFLYLDSAYDMTPSYQLADGLASARIYNFPHKSNDDKNFSKNLSNILNAQSWHSKFILSEKASDEYIISSFLPELSVKLCTFNPNYFYKTFLSDGIKTSTIASRFKNFLKDLVSRFFKCLCDLYLPGMQYNYLNLYKLSRIMQIPNLLIFLRAYSYHKFDVKETHISTILEYVLNTNYDLPPYKWLPDIFNNSNASINFERDFKRQTDLSKKVGKLLTTFLIVNFGTDSEKTLWNLISNKYFLNSKVKKYRDDLFLPTSIFKESEISYFQDDFIPFVDRLPNHSLPSRWFYDYDLITVQRLLAHDKSGNLLDEISNTIYSDLIKPLSIDTCDMLAKVLNNYFNISQ